MYKLIISKESNVVKKAKDTAMGDLMIIDGSNDFPNYPYYHGEIILHAFDFFVSLTNPEHVWTKNCDLLVRILPKGAEIIIKVE